MPEDYPLNGPTGLKQSEADIRHIFDRHVKTLFTAKWKLLDEITDWGKKNIEHIQNHVEQQRTATENLYKQKIANFTLLRDQYVKQALALEEVKDTEQINQLVSKCENLKVELAQLAQAYCVVQTVQLKTEEQILQENQNESIAQKTSNETPENNVPVNETPIENSPPSPPPTPTTPPLPVRKEQPVLRNQMLNNSNNQDNDRNSMDNSIIEKCPLCLMIFSPQMDVRQRSLHINEHYHD